MDASETILGANEATVLVDRSGIIRQWGKQVTAVVGHNAQDTLGQSLDIIIPAPLRWLHWWGFERAMRRGRLSSGKLTVPALCPDGRIIVAHATMELISTGGTTDGAILRFTGIAPPWQGAAWRVALGPFNGVRRLWRMLRPNQSR